MYFVEIIGLGGSGKTTLAKKLSLQNKNRKLNFIFPDQTKKRNLYFNAILIFIKISLKNPLFLFCLFKSSGQMWLFKKIVYRYSRINLIKNKKINILVDSGCYEPFISHAMFFNSFKNHKHYYNYFHILEKPIAVICLDINPITSLHRFISREKKLNRFNEYNASRLKDNFKSADKLYNNLKKMLKKNKIKKIEIDANTHPFTSSQVNIIEFELKTLSGSIKDYEI